MHKILTFILVIFTNFTANAVLPVEPFLASHCKSNVVLSEEILALKINDSVNDLTRKLDQHLGNSQKSIIYGRLLDQKCLPVADATLRIWQKDNAKKHTLSGKAVTNNLGEFIFITNLLHRGGNNVADIIISHHDFDQSSYKLVIGVKNNLAANNLVLANSWLNNGNSYAAFNQHNIYQAEIILTGSSQFRRY
jgi:hypothetical protein